MKRPSRVPIENCQQALNVRRAFNQFFSVPFVDEWADKVTEYLRDDSNVNIK